MNKVWLFVSLLLALAACVPSQQAAQQSTQNMKKIFVLVHGAWMDSSAWDLVKQLLEQHGETVITVNLPGHGTDATPADQVTLEAERDTVIKAIGNRKDVTLVGHSFGGMVISAVAEAIPDQLAKLIYVAAYLPRDGDTVQTLSASDKDSRVGMYWNQTSQITAAIKPEGIADVFCADCSDVQKAALVAGHKPEPLIPFGTPIQLTAANFGRVPRFYVETLQDHAVSHNLQLQMLANTPVQGRVALDSSHSPFLSQPQTLVAALEGF